MTPLILRIFRLLLTLYSLPLVSAGCYYPDGSYNTDDDYQPCVAIDGTFSMCCATNRGDLSDQCLPNGLCHNEISKANGFDGGEYWRESCTDQTWQSPFCLKNVCTNSSQTGGSSNSSAPVSQCPQDGKWCCGGDLNATTCCAADTVDIAATIGVSIGSGTISSTRTSDAAPSISLNLTSSIITTPAGSTVAPARITSSNTEEKIGLGVGIGVGGAFTVVAAAIVFIVLRRRRFQGELRGVGGFQSGEMRSSAHSFRKAELDTGRQEIFEIDGHVGCHEVSG